MDNPKASSINEGFSLRSAAQAALADEALPQRLRNILLNLLEENDRLAAELAATSRRIEHLEKLATEDPLVPVLNRRGFIRELERAISYVARHGTAAAVIFIDFDSFKSVNDRFGHAAGDATLRHVGAVLGDSIRMSDAIGRLGGDEFGIILWNATQADADAKASELMSVIEQRPLEFGGSLIRIGASAGATRIRGTDSPEEAIGRADSAMYAKKAGAGRRA